MTWAQWHRSSEALAATAHELMRQGKLDDAFGAFSQAAELEQKALDSIHPDKERTFAITAVSTAALWYKARNFVNAAELARKLLRARNLPIFAVVQLRNLLDLVADDDGPHHPASFVQEQMAIEGNIEGSGNVRIHGRFRGDISIEGSVFIESGAAVEGIIRAREVVVAGKLKGNVHNALRVTLLSGGCIVGDVTTESFTSELGGMMMGMVEFDSTSHTESNRSSAPHESDAFSEVPISSSREISGSDERLGLAQYRTR